MKNKYTDDYNMSTIAVGIGCCALILMFVVAVVAVLWKVIFWGFGL